jgi:glutamyl-tRNA(Gln) amidotransferase subunit E
MLCGIEIHQRIAGGKLFCRCQPSDSGSGGEISMNRRLHAVLSELGELDIAVRVEALRERAFHYRTTRSASCLVELDEEPPHGMNTDALHAVLVFCKLLGAKPVDRVHVMRKTVIDGSNTSGFQRTAVVGLGGGIETVSGKLGIQTVCIEEESAGILEGKENRAAYDLSRLGIPLVEIATAPELKSGKQAQEAALAIGTLLRRTGMVARGIGTIRQDLNVSIPEGARVEIKGVQALEMIEKTVETEVARQNALLKIAAEAKDRLGGREIQADFVDLTEIFADTRSQMAEKMLRGGARIFGMALPGFEGLLGREVAPGRRFGTELADYARSAGVAGLMHSDEDMGKYGFSDDELAEVKAALSIRGGDAFAMVIADEKRAFAALSEVACRANFLGVPEETRKANPDGTSSYMRPLPGKARLYPETDLPPVEVSKKMLDAAGKALKASEKMEEEREELLSGLNGELAAQLSSAKGLISHKPSFRALGATPEISAFAAAVKIGVEEKFAASTITNTLQSLKREKANTAALDEERLLGAFSAYVEAGHPKNNRPSA